MGVRGALMFGLVLLVSTSPVWATEKAEVQTENMTSLPDYLAMHRDDQLKLILKTKTTVMRSFAKSDYDRAWCIAGLFADTPEGDTQFYDLKGLLKAAAVQRPNWKAEQVIEFNIKKFLCPEKT